MILGRLSIVATALLLVVAAEAQPYVAIFTSPPDGSCARLFAQITFSVDGPLPLHVRVQDDLGHTLFNETYFGTPPPIISIGYDPLALGVPDGPHTLTLDVWGDEGSAQDTLLLNVDNTPPTPTIQYPADGQCVNGVVTIRGSVQDNFSGPGAWRLQIDGVQVAAGDGADVRYDWNTAGLPDDSLHTIRLVASDVCGNSSQTPVATVRVNNNAPTLTDIVPSQGAVVKGIVTVSALVSGGQTTEWSVMVDGSIVGLDPPSGVGSAISSLWDTTKYTDGAHSLGLTISDGCGNSATTFVLVVVSNGPTGGDGNCRPLKNLIVEKPPVGLGLTRARLFRPQTINVDGFTVRDVLEANNVEITANTLVQRVCVSKETPLYKCGAFLFGPGSGLNTNFNSGWVYANSQYLDRSVVDIAFAAQGGKLGNRALLFSPPGTTYRLKVTYVTRLENGRISPPETVELCWTVVIEDRDDLRDNVEYFSTVAAGATQKPKIADDVAQALYEAIAVDDPLEALVQIETVIALSATDFSTLRDRPHVLFLSSYLIDSDEEPIGCLLIEQANALLWR